MNAVFLPGQPRTMSSRDIAELVGTSHDSVLKTVRRLVSEGVVLGNETPYTSSQNKQTYMEFLLSFRDTMVVASGYSAAMRAKIIDRWQELEAAAPATPAPMELTRMQILEMAMDSERRAVAAESALRLAAPAVEFVERYTTTGTGNKGFREVCKLLRAKENAFRAFLADRKIMYKLGGEWTPYAEHMDAGRFAVKTDQADNDHIFNQAKFTPKGISWVAGEWAKHNLPTA